MLFIKRILILIGICLGVAVGAMAFSAINIALAAIKNDLSASMVQIQWIMNIFGIVICSSLVIFGRMADIYGRKRLYLIGIILLAISMLGSGLAPHAGWIIFFQAILGLSAAIFIPVSQALISNVFPAQERSKAIGIWAAVIGVAMAVGPLISGAVIATLGWRWVFLINLPLILASFILVASFAPESRNEKSIAIDWLGAVFLAITIACFVLAVVQGSLWKSPIIISLYIISFFGLILLLFVEKKVSAPIIREDLFTTHSFLTASVSNFCLIFFVWASFFLIPLYLQTIRHYSALQAGLMMLFDTLPMAIFSFIVGYLYKTLGPKLLISMGFIFLLISAFTQMQFSVDSKFIVLVLGILALGIGMGLIWGPTTTAAISALPLEDAGIASGTFVTIQEIGGTLGLAITVAVVRTHSNLMTGYHNGMWVLVLMCTIGLIVTFAMRKKENFVKNF